MAANKYEIIANGKLFTINVRKLSSLEIIWDYSQKDVACIIFCFQTGFLVYVEYDNFIEWACWTYPLVFGSKTNIPTLEIKTGLLPVVSFAFTFTFPSGICVFVLCDILRVVCSTKLSLFYKRHIQMHFLARKKVWSSVNHHWIYFLCSNSK